MEVTPRILVIPDAYGQPESGGLSPRHQVAVMRRQGWHVGVFAPDVQTTPDGLYRRKQFSAMANYRAASDRREFNEVLDDFRPSHVFSVGGVINRPLGYFDLILARRIPHIYMLYCQDFYCSRIHAALEDGPCYKCLRGSRLNAFAHHCAVKTTRSSAVFLAANTLNRIRLRSRLRRVDWLLGSTKEQLSLLGEYGIEPRRLVQLSLPFPRTRIDGARPVKGEDIVIAGQSRIEKGIHLLRHVLSSSNGPRVRIAFSRRLEGEQALRDYGLEPYVRSGRLVPHFDMTWDTGLKELCASALGVLILSQWPTTTEFALLEALGMGKPVICYDVGIHAERIIQGVNGLKASVGDHDGIAASMLALQQDQDLYETVSAGALRLFVELTDDARLMNTLQQIIG